MIAGTIITGRTPIGLDVGPRTIAAAQLARAGGGWRLEASALIDRPPDAGMVLRDTEAVRIGQILLRQGFARRDVVLAVPDQRLVMSMLELPPRSSGAPIEHLARVEMARAHRLESGAGGFEMACWEVPGPPRAAAGSHMMAVACRHGDADELIDGLQGSRLRVAVLDVRAWAIARACLPAKGAEGAGPRVRAVLELSEDAALLVIVHEGRPAYERLIAEGALGHLRAAIRTKLGVEGEVADFIFSNLRLGPDGGRDDHGGGREATVVAGEHFDNLASELRTAIGYAEHRFEAEIDCLFLQGTGAAIPGVVAHLSGLIGIPAKALHPADVVTVPAGSPPSAHSPALMTAVGLAMHDGGRP